MSFRSSLLLWGAIAALTITGCGDEKSTQDDADWGAAAEVFFADWESAWSSADPYEIARFYDPNVTIDLVQDYRTLSLRASNRAGAVSGNGRAWLADWVVAQLDDEPRSIQGVYFGSDSSVVMSTVPTVETALAVAMDMTGEAIVTHRDVKWRNAHLPGGAPDARLDWLDEFVADYVAGWTGNPDLLDRLYATDAIIESFPDRPTAYNDKAESAFGSAELTRLTTGTRTGPALFYGGDLALFSLKATLADGCDAEMMVVLELLERTIVSEQRLPTAMTVRACFDADATGAGWWQELGVPPPVSEQVTGSVTSADGWVTTIINGSPELERLLSWGLGRFERIGMVPPQLSSVTFAPVPACADVPGVVIETELPGSDLVLCTDAHQACVPDRTSCVDFNVADRFGLLHELGHAWLLDNVDDATRDAFVELKNLDAWRDGSAPWFRRGVEQAAETLAWGLMEEPVRLARIGDPACAQIAAGFELLTGMGTPHECAA